MSQSIEQAVKSKYGSVATSGLSSDHAGVRDVAEAFGYTPEQLASIPAEANMGLSCGNPTAFASLRPGETVVDLGCGGGLDVLLAAAKVGPKGKAIGIDMTPEMIELARKNAGKPEVSGVSHDPGTGDDVRKSPPLCKAGTVCASDHPVRQNIEFHLATIDQLPLADNSVDCLISNCVINLAPDKRAVFREMLRVLKPGGRVAVSDIALKKPLPDEIGLDLMAYVGCIAGAILMEDYERGLREAGFEAVQIVDTRKDLNAYAKVEGQNACCSPSSGCASGLPIVNDSPTATLHETLADLLTKYNVNDYAASVQVYAIKSPIEQ
jgi:arsenite methyltransferase